MLLSAGKISEQIVVDDLARKTMLISAASYFEVKLSEAVLTFCKDGVGSNTLIPAIVESKAIKRQYHTWFTWDAKNANTFFSLFGADFLSHMKKMVAESEELEDQIKAFLELGLERNRLVHGDYAAFSVEKTAEEIYQLYLKALLFVEAVPAELNQCAKALSERAIVE